LQGRGESTPFRRIDLAPKPWYKALSREGAEGRVFFLAPDSGRLFKITALSTDFLQSLDRRHHFRRRWDASC
jgi:hypothetical protein